MLTLYSRMKSINKKEVLVLYENLTYDQLKELPDEQKVEALKELKARYPDNKDLAEHLGGAHIAVSNMVGKYLEGKQLGRKPMTEEEKKQKKEEKLRLKQEEAEKERLRLLQEQQTQHQVKDEEEVSVSNGSFSVKFGKTIIGEEATVVLSSIGNSLLKDGKYKVSLNIEEV
jgi:hypothetical protein